MGGQCHSIYQQVCDFIYIVLYVLYHFYMYLCPCMSHFIYIAGDFEWLSQEEIDILYDNGLHAFDALSTQGLILEADVHYPAHLHESHSDLPMCPDCTLIDEIMLSPYQQRT